MSTARRFGDKAHCAFLANNASSLPGQSRYDNAEPDTSGERREEAIEDHQDRIWRYGISVQEAVEMYGMSSLPLSVCDALVKERNNPKAEKWVADLIAYLDDNAVSMLAEREVDTAGEP